MNLIKIAFYTIGCKLNFAETSTISRNIIKNPLFKKVEFTDFADFYIINTCSVTNNADKEFKYLVNKTIKNNKKAFIIAIGCYAQLNPKKILKIKGVNMVLGASEKFNISKYINNILYKKNIKKIIHSCEINNLNYITSYSLGNRTRSFLKIQDGCDYKCTYCTIPLARGKSRSEKLEDILKNIKEIINHGVKEIVLTGINIGDYGKYNFNDKNHKYNFLDLIKILDKIQEIKRIRISSIEPNLLLDEIILFIKNSQRFVPHFHIPLQSGSDTILKKMKRRYLTNLYFEKVKKIKYNIPNASIGVDVIVGFPGETDDHFLETYFFLSKLEISYIHVFTYSERDNTEAINFKNIVPKEIRYKRNKILRELSEQKKYIFYKKNINTKNNVLFENTNKNGYIYGYTDNFIRIKTKWNINLINTIKQVKLTKIDNDGFMLINY